MEKSKIGKWNLSAVLVIVAGIIALESYCIGVSGDDEVDLKTEEEEKSCKELIVDGIKKAIKEIPKCTRSLGLKTKAEKKEKSACIMRCVATNIGFLTEEGEIDETSLIIFVDENIPKKYYGEAFQVMGDCMHHAGNLDPKEATCKSYEPIFKCVIDSATKFAKMCST